MKRRLHRMFPRLHHWTPYAWDNVSCRYVFEACSCDSLRLAR